MARNKRPARKHKPMGLIRVNPLALLQRMAAAQSTAPLDKEQAFGLSARAHESVTTILAGNGTTHDFDTLAAVGNISRLLCLDGLGEEHMPLIDESRDAIEAMRQRYLRTGRIALDGPGLQAVNALLEFHDALLESPDCTEGKVLAAVEASKALIAAGRVHHLQPQHIE
jgi:hypothetical protein